MSLVNDMLRDLNKRTPVSNRAARVHGAIQSSINSKKVKVRTGLILAGGLLAGLAGGYFYFESMGVQFVPVPMAVVPGPPTPSLPAASPSTTTAPASIAPSVAAGNQPAVETVVEIRELAMQPNGFTLLIEVTQETRFDVLDRSANGLTLHIEGVDRYDRAGTTVPGMSLLLGNDGLDIGLELDAPADFLVREDTETQEFDILITASYRANELSDVTSATPETPGPADPVPQPVEQSDVAVATTSAIPSAPAPAPTSTAGERQSPVRVSRELSFEDRDRNNSQAALMAVQGGQMTEAYRLLLTFIEENPAAHQSRETLAKLLLAQQEYAQAGTIVDQGLSQAPNNAAFKKIKARLLMQDDDATQALALLRNVPPPVSADTEYHELLASLYQKANAHEQAIATYQQLLRTDRTQGRWWAGLGISLEAQDMNGDALASFQTALQAPNLDASLRKYVQGRIGNLSAQQ